jgi:hypothetical protein
MICKNQAKVYVGGLEKSMHLSVPLSELFPEPFLKALEELWRVNSNISYNEDSNSGKIEFNN